MILCDRDDSSCSPQCAKDGVFSVEVQAFMVSTGTQRDTVREFLQSAAWRFPQVYRHTHRDLWRIFDERRVSTADPNKVKASCKEFLAVYAMLRYFVECHVAARPEHSAFRASFLAACKMLDLILAAKFRFDPLRDVVPALEASRDGWSLN